MHGILPSQHSLLLHELLQGYAVDILHDYELYLLGKAHVVYFDDVRVAEHRYRLGLVAEAPYKIIIVGVFVLQDLYGNSPVFMKVNSLVDLCHAAYADKLGNFIAAVEFLADVFIHRFTSLQKRLT